MDKDELLNLKRAGFLDKQIGKEDVIRSERKKSKILPTYKMVDTCAGEFDAATPYYYSTYEHEDESVASDRKKVIILGSGPIRIGQGIEFDCCTVHAVFALRAMGIETIIVNSNPETVSTDFDISDKLYFEPITLEDVLNIVDKENKNLLGVMVQFGGQTAINLAIPLHKHGVNILGTSPEDTDRAEDRDLFGKVLDKLKIPSAEWGTGYTFEEVKKEAKRIGYPVLVRPSYVLGGRAMEIVHDESELEEYIKEAASVSPDHPILVDKFLDNATELDVDVVCDGKDVLIGAIMEQIEEGGIHSGDSACVIPPQNLSHKIIETVKDYSTKLALELNVKGLLNIQYAIKDNIVYVLEANPRSSRTVPFVSKAVGVPIAKLAARVMVGEKLADITKDFYPMDKIKHVAVKEVVFPFTRLPGVDPVLSPEMKSTGEVMGIDKDFAMAFYKSQLAAGNDLPLHGAVFISAGKKNRTKLIPVAKKFLELGFEIVSTFGTSEHLWEKGIKNTSIYKISDGSPNILDYARGDKIDLIINIPGLGKGQRQDGYKIRTSAIELDIPYFTTITGATAAVNAIEKVKERKIEVKSLNDYFKKI
jgi:carbamoyl-phosphate synthase large subunit